MDPISIKKAAFSEMRHEYIMYDPRNMRREDRNGREVCSVPGTGSVSGRDYLLVLVDGRVDDLHTRAF